MSITVHGLIILPNWKKEIGSYAGIGYRDINTYLRTYNGQLLGVNPNIEEKIKQLDHALQTAKLMDTIVVYRRVSETAFGSSQQSLIDKTIKLILLNYKNSNRIFLANIKRNMLI